MPILINSFDHDGCVASSKFKSPSELIGENHALFDVIRGLATTVLDDTPYFNCHKVMIGSNRQSLQVDTLNATRNTNGAVVPLAQAISKHLDAEFDGFTLADIKSEKEPGYHTKLFLRVITELNIDPKRFMYFNEFAQIDKLIKQTDNGYEFSDFDASEDKINILYAQIHHQASLHPDEEIVFNFFDDKQSILDSLNEFFKRFPEFLPENVELNLYLYNQGELALCHPPIQGEHFIDHNYYETVNIMGQIARKIQGGNPRTGYTMADYITPELIHETRAANTQREKAPELMEMAKIGQTLFFKPLVESQENPVGDKLSVTQP